jgi:hypothetical protein
MATMKSTVNTEKQKARSHLDSLKLVWSHFVWVSDAKVCGKPGSSVEQLDLEVVITKNALPVKDEYCIYTSRFWWQMKKQPYLIFKIWGFHGGDYEESHLLGCRCVVLVGTDISEECIASIFRLETTNKFIDSFAQNLMHIGCRMDHETALGQTHDSI